MLSIFAWLGSSAWSREHSDLSKLSHVCELPGVETLFSRTVTCW